MYSTVSTKQLLPNEARVHGLGLLPGWLLLDLLGCTVSTKQLLPNEARVRGLGLLPGRLLLDLLGPPLDGGAALALPPLPLCLARLLPRLRDGSEELIRDNNFFNVYTFFTNFENFTDSIKKLEK